MTKLNFKVIDNITRKEANISEIVLKEDWAKGLMYCDMQGFALLEDGNLVLLDECGKWEYCPSDRFEIIPEGSVVMSKEEWKQIKNSLYYSKEELENKLQKARKETAKEILQEIIQVKKEVRFRVGMGEIFPHKDLIEKLYELAKKYGVEVDDVNIIIDNIKGEKK